MTNVTSVPARIRAVVGVVAVCIAAALHRMTWRAALASLFLANMLYLTRLVELLTETDAVPEEYFFSTLLIQVLVALCIMFATFVADEAVARGAQRFATYALAVAIGSAAAAFAQWHLRDAFGLRVITSLPGVPREVAVTQPLVVFFEMCIWGGIVVFIYVNRRTAAAAATRMHSAEIERARTQRRTLESRLQALQARVEPQFLFNTLAQVRELYANAPALGALMLDDLIAYLRAALPHLRESTSTLGRELDLVRAYLNIMRVRLGERLAVQIEMPPSAQTVRMPPMILLPLIDHALVYGFARPNASGSISIDTQAEAGRLRLTIADSGAAFVPGGNADGLHSIAERLAALYGDQAALKLEPLAGRGTRAVIEIPYEAAGGDERAG